ncbi:hypothetical protein QCN29_11565 [Streptomyces sp. HNM0663]|uniref:Uncharacterized protein n=1 Tax=Streptomyces chengmaiensis TaxID=3040919 RepID=A0ABT6HLC5_9ACTN|nr:hypothetical protein [Streptomyces chengmaiensis]MDH2389420.1 hypothetical protein [Streptomyces chengmaiensis]
MTDNEAPRTIDARRHLDHAVRAMDHVQARYEVAMLDYITARIVEAHPQTTHLTFVHATADGLIELDGLWATRDGGTEELLHDLRGGGSATVGFDPGEIGDDLTYALDRLNSVAWSAVRPQTLPGKRWVLDLPPADRAARIAALVRVHHPDAGLLTVDLSAMRPRVAGVTTVGATGVGPTVHAEPDRPLWPEETGRIIRGLIWQIRSLPHLRARYVTRVGGSAEETALLLLPQTETGSGE